MNKTIDDFKNFFKPDKEKELFSPRRYIEKTLSLVGTNLEKNSITIDMNFENETVINGYANEFTQVILNIISNAIDAFIENNIENRHINITISKHNKQTKIIICDNAGGINLFPVEKVFELYVSTKHQSRGPGIGLYMCKNIIEKSMNGSLSVKNHKKGACFTILL